MEQKCNLEILTSDPLSFIMDHQNLRKLDGKVQLYRKENQELSCNKLGTINEIWARSGYKLFAKVISR